MMVLFICHSVSRILKKINEPISLKLDVMVERTDCVW